MRTYKQLTYDDRCQIDILLKRNTSKRDIAKIIKRDVSTIYREINRNSMKKGYGYIRANQLAALRRKTGSKRSNYKWTYFLQRKILKYLKKRWSPEQISGRLYREFNIEISHTRIYQHIHEDKRRGGKLYKYLRRRGKQYYIPIYGSNRRGIIKGRIDISERPKIVEEKSRLGDIECDLIMGKDHKGAIVSLVDRASKYVFLDLVKSKKSSVVSESIVRQLRKEKIETLTFDNGKEFSGHQKIGNVLNAQTYFARPYSSWERGLNEHTNGLVRDYLPKKTRFDMITKSEVRAIAKALNNRPRKVLNYQTPREYYLQLAN